MPIARSPNATTNNKGLNAEAALVGATAGASTPKASSDGDGAGEAAAAVVEPTWGRFRGDITTTITFWPFSQWDSAPLIK